MMKILTQKMVGAQGLEAGMSGFCHFEIPGLLKTLSFRAKRGICFLLDAGRQQVPRRFRSSE
jgi:hypothetical protein